MAWLIRCPLKLHLPLTRCVQGRGRPPETTQSSLCHATLSFTRIPHNSKRKWSQDSSFVYRSQYESLLFLWLKTNTWLMTDDVLFWAPPFSAYLCGGVGSNVSGGWCGTSSRMEPRTLAGGLGGGLFHIPSLQVEEDLLYEAQYIQNNEAHKSVAYVCAGKTSQNFHTLIIHCTLQVLAPLNILPHPAGGRLNLIFRHGFFSILPPSGHIKNKKISSCQLILTFNITLFKILFKYP